MKHLPLILMNRGNFNSNNSTSSTFGRQLLEDDGYDDDYYDTTTTTPTTAGTLNNVVDLKNHPVAISGGIGDPNNHGTTTDNDYDDGEGTECIIDSRNLRISPHVDTTITGNSMSMSTTDYHPPMCGQVFISKVIGQGGGGGGRGGSTSSTSASNSIKKQQQQQQQPKAKELKPRRSYNRRNPITRLVNKNGGTPPRTLANKKRSKIMMTGPGGGGGGCSNSFNGGGGGGGGGGGMYHESFSAEQSPDSDSETSSVQSSSDRIRILTTTTKIATIPVAATDDNHHHHHDSNQNTSSTTNNSTSSNRSCGGDSDTSSLPSQMVQFDPNELELIKTEKIVLQDDVVVDDTNSLNRSNGSNLDNNNSSQSKSKSAVPTTTTPSVAVSTSSTSGRKSSNRGGGSVKSLSAALLSFPFSSLRTNTTVSSLLPTVAEEKSFDLIESPSTTTSKSELPQKEGLKIKIKVSPSQDITKLLPTASSTSSSGDEEDDGGSEFFTCSASPTATHTQNRNQNVDSGEDDNDDDDPDELRDDRETVTMPQLGCFTPTAHHNEGNFLSSDSETSPDTIQRVDRQKQSKQRNAKISDDSTTKQDVVTEASSPEMMEILKAMRQIILKQQDAIQAISHENIEFRSQLAMCHREMKSMQGESADQLIQITQLVIQKNSMDTETTQLKDEVAILRDEILRLKSDDADLVNRFESLMNDNGDTTDDDTTVDKSETIRVIEFHNSSSNVVNASQHQRDISPLNDGSIDPTGTDNESWRQMLHLNDIYMNNDDNTTADEIIKNDDSKAFHANRNNSITFAKPSNTEETSDSITTVDVMNTSYSSNSVGMSIEVATATTIENAPEVTTEPSKNTSFSTTTTAQSSIATTPERPTSTTQEKHVAEFKNRLGEIQKKRLLRMGTTNNTNISTATQPTDRKTFTVRFL